MPAAAKLQLRCTSVAGVLFINADYYDFTKYVMVFGNSFNDEVPNVLT